MPRGDGTGPAGMGPMTGRAAGYCAGYPVPGYMNPVGNFPYGVNPIGGRMGMGWGRGFGRGRGWGRGFPARRGGSGGGRGWGRDFGGAYGYGAPYYPAYPYAPELSPKEETDMLKEQAKAMQEELKAINDRISELASAAKKNK